MFRIFRTPKLAAARVGFAVVAFLITLAATPELDAGGTISSLGVLSGGTQSVARPVSADGLAAAGDSDLTIDSGAGTSVHAFRWTTAGMQDLGTLNLGAGFDSPTSASFGNAISGDGSCVAGESVHSWV